MVAVVKPAKNALAGDYALGLRASAGSQSSSLDIRYGVKGSQNARNHRRSRSSRSSSSVWRGCSAASVGDDIGDVSDRGACDRDRPQRSGITLETHDLTKRYELRTAVNSLNLKINRGEIFGLLGPNGAGKTTTILMLLGLTEPTSGTAEVDGLDPRRDPLGVKRRVGYLPDDVGFYDDVSARDNLLYTARLNRMREREADRAGRVPRRPGRSRDVDRSSGPYLFRGMRQRLGLADALIKRPSILILDEPTVNIDPEGVREILALRPSARDERDHRAVVVASAPPGRTGVRSDRHLRQRPARRGGHRRGAGRRTRGRLGGRSRRRRAA